MQEPKFFNWGGFTYFYCPKCRIVIGASTYFMRVLLDEYRYERCVVENCDQIVLDKEVRDLCMAAFQLGAEAGLIALLESKGWLTRG